ncbi:polyketide cyclase [Streptomyces sp. NBC_00539]|uniref:polyketide cyclase n=1 Tax=Streptomyces sp. NBC_00539 TaxID=2975770 RepID=UPI002E80552A|nr:polyketide cyclase [Streptomyces sp. NBC_00539]WUC69214.1 polyketide cyclase [Streptomyces sp. NBC_00539]
MWTYEHSTETDAAPEAIWRLWADVENWGVWNTDIASIQISGPFAAGAEIVMTPAGQDPVHLIVAEATVNELFVDEARFDGLLLRTIHRLDQGKQGRTRVTYRMEITGTGADQLGPRIGPAVTADWPETMAALVKLAQD